jgi:hypothetical protein
MDEKSLLVLEIARKIDSTSNFSFATRRVKSGDHQVWQISLMQDQGDRSGSFLFASGEGDSQEAAMSGLFERFRTVVKERHTAAVEKARRSAERHEMETNNLWEVLGLLNQG